MLPTSTLEKHPTMERRPAWGVGMAYRPMIHKPIMHWAKLIDFLEIPAEDYVNEDRRMGADADESLLTEACQRFPVIGHGNYMSIGSAQAPKKDYFDSVVDLCRRAPLFEYSDHLAWTRAGSEFVDAFVSVPFTDMGLAAAVGNAKWMKRRVGLPLLLENVTYHFCFTEGTMTEAEFISNVAKSADTGIMLDIANVFINSTNHHYDGFKFIDSLPAERILHCHFCGALCEHDGYFLDTHEERTLPEVWKLLDHTLAKTALRTLTLERDAGFEPFKPVIDELWKAKEIFLKHRPAKAPTDLKPTVRVAPDPAAENEAPAYSADLAKFQQVMLRILLEPALCKAIDKEGESALKHTGLGQDERRILASIPAKKRDRMANGIRMSREEDKRMQARRERDMARFAAKASA